MKLVKIYLRKHPHYKEFYEFHWTNRSSVEHIHCDSYEIVLTLKPYIKQYLDGNLTTLDKHTIYIIAPHLVHKISFEEFPVSDQPFLFNLAIDEHVFQNICNMISSNIISRINSEKCVKVNLTDEEFTYLFYLISKLSKTVDAHMSSEYVKHIVSNIFYIMNTQKDIKAQSRLQSYAYTVKEKIDNLEYLTTDIKEIYSKYPVSFSSLIAAFKKITGKTIINYIVEQRMAYAKLLLVTTNYSIIDIAQTLGYSSQSFFIQVFKKHYGKTPLQYKKDNQSLQ